MGVRREARMALDRAGLRPQRRFGQHFLCDPGVVRRIVQTAALGPASIVLEIGPGLGALTAALVAAAGRVHLVEVDRGLAARLREQFAGQPSVYVYEGDFLVVPPASLVPEAGAVVVANLPYNVSTPILFRLLEYRAWFPRAVLMVQREVAERLVAKPGSRAWGVLPALVQTWGEVSLAFGVSRRSFFPRPRVDSAVITIAWLERPRVALADPALFRAVVRAAFGQRRKTLRNALGPLARTFGVDAAAILAAAEVAPGARAETLSLEAFARLSRALGAAAGATAIA